MIDIRNASSSRIDRAIEALHARRHRCAALHFDAAAYFNFTNSKTKIDHTPTVSGN
jgi:hypothetical protein